MSDFRIGKTGEGFIDGFSKNGNHFKVVVALDIDGYEVMTDIYCSCAGSKFNVGDKIEAMIFNKEETQDGDGMLVGGLKLLQAAGTKTATKAGNGRKPPATKG